MQILKVEGVSKSFGGRAAVDNVSFELSKGEILGLIGPNGAGKSTLFNLISGALPMDSGTIHYNGVKISGKKPNDICRLGIARTFQAAKNFPGMPVRMNVMMGALFGKKGVSHTQAEKDADEIIEFVGLADQCSKSVSDITLAGQKRLEVARALATKPELILLDEMMAGLNPTEVEEAMVLVGKIRDRGITVIMIEHVMRAIMNTCGRIVVLHHGEKIAEGLPEEISTSSTVIEVYFGKA